MRWFCFHTKVAKITRIPILVSCFTDERTGFQQRIFRAWKRCREIETKKMVTNNNDTLCNGYKSKISGKLNDNCPFSHTTTNLLLGHASFIRSADNALLTQKIAIERMCPVSSQL